MESLYEYALNDIYNYINEHGTTNDTIYYNFGLYDCLNEFNNAYDIDMENSRILNKIPDVNVHNPSSILYVLKSPKLDQDAIVIPIYML